MIHIIAQPQIDYYTWQVEVVINSIQNQMPDNKIQIICSKSGDPTLRWDILEKAYPDVSFYYYEDTRLNPCYISSIRPHILEKHFKEYPELSNEVIFYHDSDIVFNKPLDLNYYSTDDVWYLSDTNSYINYDYIKSKGDDVLQLMCDIVGIEPEVIQKNNSNSGGAQYIMKNVDDAFWNEVYMDSENLYGEVTKLNNIKKQENPDYHELQIWCADMWGVLWNAWKRGYTTICDPQLNFNWSTTHTTQWMENSIYHNAGVTAHCEGMFFKNRYTYQLPYNIVLESPKMDVCAFNYFNYVQEIGYKSFLSNTISIVVVCTNKYSVLGLRFVNNFMKHYKGNKKIIFNIFTDVAFTDFLPEYNRERFLLDINHFENTTWTDGTNSKFSNILSLDAYGEYIYYFDADTNINKDFDENWFIGDLVGGEHYINNVEVKNYDRNPLSKAYVPFDTPFEQIYYYGAFFGGASNRVFEMCKVLYDSQISDKLIPYEPGVNDESYLNNFFHYNKPQIVRKEDFAFVISDKGGIDDIRYCENVGNELEKIKHNRNTWFIEKGKVHYK